MTHAHELKNIFMQAVRQNILSINSLRFSWRRLYKNVVRVNQSETRITEITIPFNHEMGS
jgi:hypothetical protein